MPIANINGVELNYQIAGQGNAVVIVHGYTGSAQDWENQIAALAPKHMVIALDLRGHGKSAAPSTEEEYSIPIFSEDVLTLIKQLDIAKCCLIGHSMGGFIAMQFALTYPDMLAALVLVSTNSGDMVRVPGFAELRQKLDEIAMSQGMEAAFEYDVMNNPQRIERFRKHPEHREITREKMLRTSVDGYVNSWRAISKWESVTSRLSEITMPTLIYWGDEDVAMANGVQTLKKGIANSELITLKGVSHSPHWESPDFFNDKLLDFLTRIDW